MLDVRDGKAVDNCFAAIELDQGPATHAVANAGIVAIGSILDITDEQWHQVIDVTLHGVMYFCRAAKRHMVPAKRGSIVNLASIAGLASKPKRLAYTASKAAVVNMTVLPRSISARTEFVSMRSHPGSPKHRSSETNPMMCSRRAPRPCHWAAWGNPKTLPRWCCSCCRIWPAMSPATRWWQTEG